MQEFEENIIYCQNCGKANNNNSSFCNYCGSRINRLQIELKLNQVQDNSTWNDGISNDEIEREFVIANLQDLHNLYFASRNFQENIRILSEKKSKLGNKRALKKPIEPAKPAEPKSFKSIIIDFASEYHVIGITIVSILLTPLLPVWLIILLIATIVIFIIYRKDLDKYKEELEIKYPQELKEYNEAMEEYQKDLQVAEEEYEKEINIGIPNLERAIDDLDKERNEALELIDECYDINIIPSKYRNIYAIRFIYDYMATSNGSLRDALFACDLDNIQAQLEKVIQNQGSMICKLAKIEANSEKQIQQQEQMINHLKYIEANTYDTARAAELNARYNRIIAHNTNVMAYCSTMTYIDNRDIDDFNYYSPQTIKDFGLERFAQYYEK